MAMAPDEQTGFDPASPDSYVKWGEDIVRFRDLDTLGHVTSLSFLVMFETARVMFFRDSGVPVDDPDCGWMLVRVESDFLSQLHFPGTVRIGTRVHRLGNTSLTTAQGLFSGERCASVMYSTLVYVSRDGDRAVPIPEPVRERMLAMSPA